MVYAKMFMQVVATVLAGVVAFLTDNNITTSEWLQIAVIGVTAANVFVGPNVPGANYTKVILSVLGAALAAMIAALTDGISISEWLVVGMAVLGSVGVYAIKNAGTTTVAVNQRA